MVASHSAEQLKFGAVVIGRNEGDRLKRCLRSCSRATIVVYVDSGSTDGSAEWARTQRAEVVELDTSVPFSAARARNSGFMRLRELAPQLSYVQFIDGDCELNSDWPQEALRFLDAQSDVAVVAGRLRERHPDASVYNWLCEREWETPPGEVNAGGGIAMIRCAALVEVRGYREELIAGEEPELCIRLRQAKWRIWRLDNDMAWHDAAMFHFRQWWRRATRSGYGFAQGALLHGAAPERHYDWESRRARLWGIWLPLACLGIGLAYSPWGWALWLIYPLQVLRLTARNSGALTDRATLAFFQVLARFPEAFGQARFFCDRALGRQARLIEHK